MVTQTLSPERAAFLAERTEKLEQGYAELTDAENFRAYLGMLSKLHQYSFHNTLLIWMQLKTATACAGYNQWKEMGRQVRKGETALRIYAPLLGRKDPETGEQIIYGFRSVSVFDISQTDGPELPREQLIKSYKENLTDFPQAAQWDKRLRAWLKKEGIPVELEKLDGNHFGYYSIKDKKVVLNKGLTKTQQFHTLLHETAHHLTFASSDETLKKMSKTNHELTAESVAYVAAAFVGFDTTLLTLPYLGLYTIEADQLKAVMPTIRTLSTQLMGILNPETV